MALSLSMIDAGNGATVLASITLGTIGAFNTIRVGQWDGAIGSISIATALSPTITGNNTQTYTFAPGFYWAQAANNFEQSNLVYFHVASMDDAVHVQCLDAVEARIQSLNLTGLASIVVQGILADRDLGITKPNLMPAIVLAGYREAMDPRAGTNERDDVIYPVICAIVAPHNQQIEFDADQRKYIKWRQKIARAFRNQRLEGVGTVINASVEPQEWLLPEGVKQNLFVDVLLLKFTSREPRGLSA